MRKTRRAKKKQKKLIILIVFFIVLFFSVGYALLQQKLNIFGTAKIDTSYYDESGISYTCTKTVWKNSNYDYQFDCTVKNETKLAVKNWTILLVVPNKTTLTNSWGARVTLANDVITVKSNTWDTLNAGSSIIFHLQISHNTNGTIDFSTGGAINDDVQTEVPEDTFITEGMSAVIKQTANWSKYYQFEIIVTNKTGQKLLNWEVKISVPEGTIVNNFWSNNYIHSGNYIIITPIWNNVIENNNSVNFAFQLEYEGTNFSSAIVSVKGSVK